jgi:hypothetical protein
MQPEERFDALLSQRLRESMREEAAEESANESADLAPLLDAVERFAVRGDAEPSAPFADQLEATLLARFAVPAGDAAAADQINGETEGALPQMELLRAHTSSSIPETGRPLGKVGRFIPRPMSTPWRAVAALLLLGIGIFGGLAMAARSGLLLNDAARVGTATQTPALGEGDSVRAHLQQAQDALVEFNQAVKQQLGDQAYQAALAHFADEETKASADISTLPADTVRTTLAAQLTALRERGRKNLRAALPILSWSVRVLVTSVLDKLGDTVPKIGQTAILGAVGHDSYVWTITVSGSGFASGAMLLIDNQPVGVTMKVSTTQVVAQVSSASLADGAHHVSVGNPDGTVADGGVITLTRPDDHGGRGGGSGSGSGGSGGGGG